MKRLFIFLFLLIFPVFLLFPGEGMWLPVLLEKYNIEEMQEKGFRLTAEDIYSINRSSMKDAVVRIGGCTGVVVSESGLVLTNHHCAYRVIQSHSSVDNDYLTDGFWAMSREEELPNRGLTVTFLVRMEDVTERVLAAVNREMNENERAAAIMKISRAIEQEAVEGTGYRADVNAFYHGSEFYLFIYDVFEDIRLVGAPPSSIGKFGGDTDNWMWPRHTGDFAFFRIYAGEDNRPASWSAGNIPYRAPVSIPLSTKGINEGDFTMVYGFPGSTRQYLTSHAVSQITGISNPAGIKLRDERLRIMGEHMSRSDTVRIKYASKFASVSNAWKRWQGENRGLARLNAIERKKEIEGRFARWVSESPEREERYSHILPAFDDIYAGLERYAVPFEYGREALTAIEMVRFVNDFMRLAGIMSSQEHDNDGMALILGSLADDFFADYHQPVDKEIFVSMLEKYNKNVPEEFHPGFFSLVHKDFDSDFSDFQAFADYVFRESLFGSRQDVFALAQDPSEEGLRRLENDIFTRIVNDIRLVYNEQVVKAHDSLSRLLDPLYRLYIQGLREMEPERAFFPDANRTLRVAYGRAGGYYPADGVRYGAYTTLSGVMEKNRTGHPDYLVPEKLAELYRTRDFGPWAVDGEMRVGFIASNHTTGGNSGSPVFNGDGHLVGVNFDRVWEGTMSDIMFDPDRCRNISVDINYILFITDRFAGAGHLIDEMTIIN